MNAFNVNDGYVDVIGTIKGTPAPATQVTLASSDLVDPDLTDLIDILPATQQYSYNFDGNAQVLDHIILNHKALVFLNRFAYARDDSDFAVKNYESTNELHLRPRPARCLFQSDAFSNGVSGVVSGRIMDNRRASAGPVVQLSGSQMRKTITDANGSYRFENVETGGFYAVTPTRANYAFSPASRSSACWATRRRRHSLLSRAAIIRINRYCGVLRASGVPRVLGREPEETGFNYWSDQINQCAEDQSCASERRRDVAAAFFIAQEFQLTGSFVHGLYKGLWAGVRLQRILRRSAAGKCRRGSGGREAIVR
jgi:hypothetical protein